MFSLCLFVCLLAEFTQKTTQLIFTKLDGKVAHVPRKKRIDFGCNLDHITFL